MGCLWPAQSFPSCTCHGHPCGDRDGSHGFISIGFPFTECPPVRWLGAYAPWTCIHSVSYLDSVEPAPSIPRDVSSRYYYKGRNLIVHMTTGSTFAIPQMALSSESPNTSGYSTHVSLDVSRVCAAFASLRSAWSLNRPLRSFPSQYFSRCRCLHSPAPDSYRLERQLPDGIRARVMKWRLSWRTRSDASYLEPRSDG